MNDRKHPIPAIEERCGAIAKSIGAALWKRIEESDEAEQRCRVAGLEAWLRERDMDKQARRRGETRPLTIASSGRMYPYMFVVHRPDCVPQRQDNAR